MLSNPIHFAFFFCFFSLILFFFWYSNDTVWFFTHVHATNEWPVLIRFLSFRFLLYTYSYFMHTHIWHTPYTHRIHLLNPAVNRTLIQCKNSEIHWNLYNNIQTYLSGAVRSTYEKRLSKRLENVNRIRHHKLLSEYECKKNWMSEKSLFNLLLKCRKSNICVCKYVSTV